MMMMHRWWWWSSHHRTIIIHFQHNDDQWQKTRNDHDQWSLTITNFIIIIIVVIAHLLCRENPNPAYFWANEILQNLINICLVLENQSNFASCNDQQWCQKTKSFGIACRDCLQWSQLPIQSLPLGCRGMDKTPRPLVWFQNTEYHTRVQQTNRQRQIWHMER